MHVTTIYYSREHQWSKPFPAHDSKQTMIVVFGASNYYTFSKPFDDLKAAYPQAQMIGCSTSGEILGSTISDETLVVAIVQFHQSRIQSVSTAVASPEDSYHAGTEIARSLASDDLRGAFVLSDGLCVNGSELIRGMNSQLPSTVVVTGGLAGDADRFQQTWILDQGKPTTKRVCAIGLYGQNLHIGHGSKGGWDIFGPERIVTKSKGNILYELDGKPALALYKEYLGERAAGLPATALLFPLAVRRNSTDEPVLVRTILAIDEASQSMTFAGDIPHGASAQLMQANFERLIEGAATAAVHTNTRKYGAGSQTLSIAISCVGRRLILGERTEEEIEAALDVLPKGTEQIGFYSYGEISPYASGRCDLHNQTMTLTTISEY